MRTLMCLMIGLLVQAVAASPVAHAQEAALFVPESLDTDDARRGILPSVASNLPIATTGDIVVRAIASFLEKRASAEFRAFVLKRLRKKLCIRGIKHWVGHTCLYLGEESDDESLPLALGAGFRTALVQDAVKLPERIVIHALPSGTKKYLILRATLETARVFVRHRHPRHVGAMLERLGDPNATRPDTFSCQKDAACDDLAKGLHLMGRIVRIAFEHGLHEKTESDATTLLTKELESVFRKDAKFFARKRIQSGRAAALARATGAAVKALSRLDTAFAPPSRESTAPDAAARAAGISRAVIELMDATVAVLQTASTLCRCPEGTNCPAFTDATVCDSMHVWVEPFISELAEVGELASALADADLPRIVSLVLVQAADAGVDVPGPVVRTLSFAVDLARAENPKEAEAIIESIAAPVGAWRAKRADNLLSITGFVGASFGHDRMSVGGDTATSLSLAPMGALGIDVNLLGKPHPDFRAGIFVSLIDVGTLMSYARGSKDTIRDPEDGTAEVEVEPSTPIGLLQVLSPGIYLRAGLFDLPVVVGVGAAYVPQARTVSLRPEGGAPGESDTFDAVRISAFVAMDITILPF